MYFSRGRLFRERPREHELGLEHGPGALDHAVQGGGQKPDHRVLHPPLNFRDDLAGVALVPMPIERFGSHPELHGEVARQVFRLGFTTFFAPEAEKGGLVVAHNDPGV